ncbi:MAG: ribonuclease catalytic domain-containing protein [Pseudanabaenaceae cyanobacterium]
MGVVERPEGKKLWQVTDQWGNSHSLKPSEIEFVVPALTLTSFRQIEPFWQEVQTYLDPTALEVVWELFLADNHAVTIPEIAQLLFSSQTPVAVYAAYYLLSEDKVYFKQKGDRYEPRPASQVEAILHQHKVAQAKAQAQAEFMQKLHDRLQGQRVEWTSQDQQRLVSLEKYALEGEESPAKAAAHEMLNQLQYPKTEQAAFQLLVDLGIWSEHENLSLKRSTIPTQFSPGLLAYAQQLLAEPIPDAVANIRRDLTHLQVYTIDDITTTEIDDGISWDGDTLWIHIADPTRWVNPDDPLDREAKQRGTTIYLPTETIPMFPPLLAEGVMSLVQGQKCHALSFGVRLDGQGAVQSYTICPSYIVPTYRLTYEDANQLLELGVEPDLNGIAQLARQRSQWRSQQGAININLPESQLKVYNQGETITLELQQNTFARQLVAEMMILAGEVAALYASAHEIPIPYRSQPPPNLPSPEQLAQLPPGVVRDFALCRCMSKSSMTIYPAPHAGLGLNMYTQATSPIRRYTDLLVHWQIKAHLAGQPLPCTGEQIDTLLKSLEPVLSEATQVERQTQRYWTLAYLQRHQDQVWRVTLLDWLRENEKLGLVLFDHLGLKLPMRFARNVTIGDNLCIRVSAVDPRQDLIQLEEADG